MKNTKTAIRELSARYRDILKKCFFLNAMALGLFAATGAKADIDVVTGITDYADPTKIEKTSLDVAVAGLLSDDGTAAGALLAAKADSATTLAGYGITDAYTKTEVDSALSEKADSATTLTGYGITDAYTKTEVDSALSEKADSATTLAGYGITDAYTTTEVDNAISTATTLTDAGNNYDANATVLEAVASIDDVVGDTSDLTDLGVDSIAGAIYKFADAVGDVDNGYDDLDTNTHLDPDAGLVGNVVSLDNAVIATEDAIDDINDTIGDTSDLPVTGTLVENIVANADAIEDINDTIGDTSDLPVAGTLVENIAANADAISDLETAVGNMGDLSSDLGPDVVTSLNTLNQNDIDETTARQEEDTRITGTLIEESRLNTLTGEYLAAGGDSGTAGFTGSSVALHLETLNDGLVTTIGTKDDVAALAEKDYFTTNTATGTSTPSLAESLSTLNDNLTATIGSTADVAGLSGSYLADAGSTIADHIEAINTSLESNLGTTEDLQTALQGEMFQAGGSTSAPGTTTLADAMTNLNDNILDAIAEQTRNLNEAQAANAAQFARVDRQIHKLETKLEKGLAANNALAGLVPLDHVHRTQISAALGGYENNTAVAVGAFHYLNSRTLLNAGAAYGGNDNVSYKVGITFGF